jgi:pSer/pThr/pTyr-binding forkhead associated (FHA) protein
VITVLDIVRGPARGKKVWVAQNACLEIGRENGVDFVIRGDKRLSRRHLLVETAGHGSRARDLGSSNGTFVNNQKVSVSELRQGDVIRIGDTAIEVSFLEDGANPVAKNWVESKELEDPASALTEMETTAIRVQTYELGLGLPVDDAIGGSEALASCNAQAIDLALSQLRGIFGSRLEALSFMGVINRTEASAESLAWLGACSPGTVGRLSRIVSSIRLSCLSEVAQFLEWEHHRDSLIVFGGKDPIELTILTPYAWALGYPSYFERILESSRGERIMRDMIRIEFILFESKAKESIRILRSEEE